MSPILPTIVSILIGASLVSGSAHAALQGRDLNGSVGSFEAYYDTVLNITWLADANYGANTILAYGNGLMNWDDANTWTAALNFYDAVHSITYNNWRLPTVYPVGASFNESHSTDGSTDFGTNISSPNSEMAYMFYVNLGNPGNFTPAGALSGCYVDSSNTCLDNVGPFRNIQPDAYWSGSGYAQDTDLAWLFSMSDGYQLWGSKSAGLHAWAVSDGDIGIATVPEASTWAMLLAGLGLVSVTTRRRRMGNSASL